MKYVVAKVHWSMNRRRKRNRRYRVWMKLWKKRIFGGKAWRSFNNSAWIRLHLRLIKDVDPVRCTKRFGTIYWNDLIYWNEQLEIISFQTIVDARIWPIPWRSRTRNWTPTWRLSTSVRKVVARINAKHLMPEIDLINATPIMQKRKNNRYLHIS